MLEYIGDIDTNRFISLNLFNVSLNFSKLNEEILQNNVKISDDPLHTQHEDSILPNLPNSEISEFLKIINGFCERDNLKLSGIWSHIHYPLESTNTHHHYDENYKSSFVFWTKVPPNSGKFVVDLGTINGPRIPIAPIQGNLLFFPPWVPHLVTKNYSKEPRISISGNLALVK
jgi:hypothetical protein